MSTDESTAVDVAASRRAERQDRLRRHAPDVVALGGGHGLAASLRAVQSYASRITGVVSVADDGGSSGRLRRELGLPALGDLRRCLSALASDESLFARSLEHRFGRGSLEGHPIGNLVLAGLAEIDGDLEGAVAEVARLVGAVGSLHPATLVPVTLVADSDAGFLHGQVTIERASGIRDLRFDPADPGASARAIDAIEAADQVVIGPGSLYTSVLACAAVPGIAAALRRSSAQRVFVANVANDRGEARGFDLEAHVRAIDEHEVPVDVVLANVEDASSSGAGAGSDSEWTTVRRPVAGVPVLAAPMAAADGWGHDPALLGHALAEVHARRDELVGEGAR